MDNIWRDNKDRHEDDKQSSRGRDKVTHPGKIIWERDETGWGDRTQRLRTEELRSGRQPVRQPRSESRWVNDYYHQNNWTGSGFRKLITNKFVVQTVVSLLVFVVAIGIYDQQDPGSKVASRAVRYLLNVDMNFEPVMGRVVKLVFPELIADGPVNPNGGVIPATTGGGNQLPQGGTLPNGSNSTGQPASSSSGQTPNTPATVAPSTEKLTIPLNGTVTRKFGWVEDSSSGLKVFHEGIDIKAPQGSAVVAAISGTVTKIGENKELGKYVLITDDGENVTLYSQLESIKVEEDQKVKSGQQIAQVGKPVGETQTHLHFEIREKGEAVDPWAKLSKEGI